MLKKVEIKHQQDQYPYHVLDFDALDLDHPVVFLTGDNGTGKSTLLKGIKYATESIDVSKHNEDETALFLDFKAVWSSRLRRGYYFQAEDFHSFLLWISQEEQANKALYDDAYQRHGGPVGMGALLELNLHKGNQKTLEHMKNTMKHVSHGEGYLEFFASKLRSNTLYLLDEPETPLSFQNQLTLMSLIHTYVQQGSQFIICTHSPVLLAYPEANIYHFQGQAIEQVPYASHPIVTDMKHFLDAPQRYLRYLFQDED